jgi:iron-sulfur cluster repair protein YtfE (RIC family)
MILSFFFPIISQESTKDIDKAEMINVIIDCYHNSARSQMAERLWRALYKDRYAWSDQ